MTRLIGTDIEYTIGDTFSLTVTGTSEFATSDLMRLQIKASEDSSEYIVNKTFTRDESASKFVVSLTEAELTSLIVGEYVYRLTLISTNTVTTTSGNFIVKWGC